MRISTLALFAGFALIAATAFLSGCAGGGKTAGIVTKAAEVRAGVVDFAAGDLEEASRIAHEANDVIAFTCWDYLITIAPEAQSNSNGKIDGIATAFQRARNAIKRVGGGVSSDLRLHCGPLYLDAKDDVSGIAGKIAALAAKFGVALPL